LGGIGERLAVKVRQLGDQRLSIVSCEQHFGVIGAEMGSHSSIEECLVESSTVGKSNGEAAHRPRALGLESGELVFLDRPHR